MHKLAGQQCGATTVPLWRELEALRAVLEQLESNTDDTRKDDDREHPGPPQEEAGAAGPAG